MRYCQTCGDAGDPKGVSGVKLVKVSRLGLECVCERCGRDAIAANPLPKAELQRRRRNRLRRERDQVRRDLGLVKTPYGWE